MSFFLPVLAASILPLATFASELEIHPIVDAPTSTSKRFPLKYFKRPQDVNVEPNVLLESGDIQSAKIFDDPFGKFGVRISFTAEAAKRLAKVSRENVNKRIGWIYNGELIRIDTVTSELPEGGMDITGSLEKAEAERLVTAINDSKKK
jgi:preprotein translocase subunit SecD